MRLAVDDTIIELGREHLRLRPSLRVAYRLETQWGLNRLIDDLRACSARTIVAIIREAAPDSDFTRFIREFDELPFYMRTAALTGPLIGYLLDLSGFDPDASEEPGDAEADTMPLTEYYERLFELATCWLGWPPEDAWNALPAEIVRAYKGRVAMLKAIFGGEDKPKQPTTAKEARAKFAAVMSRMMKRSEDERAAA